jgi:hypothetical protein
MKTQKCIKIDLLEFYHFPEEDGLFGMFYVMHSKFASIPSVIGMSLEDCCGNATLVLVQYMVNRN